LAAFPHSGAPRDDIAAGIRHIVVGEYLTFYRVDPEAVEILRVLHGRRNIDRNEIEG
jgi:toxin ParE1/3/4